MEKKRANFYFNNDRKMCITINIRPISEKRALFERKFSINKIGIFLQFFENQLITYQIFAEYALNIIN